MVEYRVYGERMIPKIIHYCWFGGKPIPPEYQRYIDSWRRFLPDYEIRRWDEANYDVRCIPFSQEAYEAGKFAYVSDYARLKILYEQGGVYFDTDVEVIRPMDDLLARGAWMGIEKHTNTPQADDMVNPGLGFAVEAHHPVVREIMRFYEQTHFVMPDGQIKMIPIVPVTSRVLRAHGMPSRVTKPVEVAGITIYPWTYFCPMEFLSNRLELREETYTIHHYTATWMTAWDKLMMKKGYWGNRLRRWLRIRR